MFYLLVMLFTIEKKILTEAHPMHELIGQFSVLPE